MTSSPARARHLVIIGGGLAGLSAGCYATASGLRVTLLEQSHTLGGVCTSWERGAYQVDGCIRWLMAGRFEQLYRELGIVPRVALAPLECLTVYRDLESGVEVPITRDLDALVDSLAAISAADRTEITLLVQTARRFAALDPGTASPGEPSAVRKALSGLFGAHHIPADVTHFLKDLATYGAEHIVSPQLRRMLCRLLPPGASTLLLAMMLGYLERGALVCPGGGSASFRDALVATYRERGGQVLLDCAVDEVVARDGRACGVRLRDGSLIAADYVISTSSIPETLLRLLGGCFGLTRDEHKLEQWQLVGPLLLVSYGVEAPLPDAPRLQVIDRVAPFSVAGRDVDHLSLRVFNDVPGCAPPGHTVVQTMISSSRAFWLAEGRDYLRARDEVAQTLLAAIDRQLPGLSGSVRMTDVATPVTYWSTSHTWRGVASDRSSPTSMFGLQKRVPGLARFYLAGQWVEPGGGVPVALLSGKHAVQLLCADAGRDFVHAAGESD